MPQQQSGEKPYRVTRKGEVVHFTFHPGHWVHPDRWFQQTMKDAFELAGASIAFGKHDCTEAHIAVRGTKTRMTIKGAEDLLKDYLAGLVKPVEHKPADPYRAARQFERMLPGVAFTASPVNPS